ncbi:MAG: hypothetical protein RL538_795 [Candidatus Parcubacteria bacterium]|jgi:hypothetical protein
MQEKIPTSKQVLDGTNIISDENIEKPEDSSKIVEEMTSEIETYDLVFEARFPGLNIYPSNPEVISRLTEEEQQNAEEYQTMQDRKYSLIKQRNEYLRTHPEELIRYITKLWVEESKNILQSEDKRQEFLSDPESFFYQNRIPWKVEEGKNFRWLEFDLHKVIHGDGQNEGLYKKLYRLTEEELKRIIIEDGLISISDESIPAQQTSHEYLSYQDAVLPEEQRVQMLEWTKTADNAQRYAGSLENLFKHLDVETVRGLAERLQKTMIDVANSIDVPVSPFGKSITWAMWDIAKQEYFVEHPDESGAGYEVASPFESEQKCEEIVNRQLGWEAYRAYQQDPSFKNLLDTKGIPNEARVLLSKAAKESNGTLSSSDLALLGAALRQR